MLDNEAATSCQMSQAKTQKDDEQNKQHKPPGEACIEVSEQSFSNAVNSSTSVQKPNTCSTPVPNDFPFHNRSFPGDPDSAVLPYPGTVDRHGNSQKEMISNTFFLLTSREAIEYKEKEREVS